MFRPTLGLVAVASVALCAPTFHKDVEPIVQKNCQTCHRPGEVAPFSLMDYASARPWAKAIKTATASRKMPPWFADEKLSNHFSNERKLTQAEIATIAEWADAGAPEGNPKDAPKPLTFQTGWAIKPDMIVEMPADFDVPASGDIDYQYTLVKTNFKEDMWIVSAEMRPGNNAVVHHGEAWVRFPGSKWMDGAKEGVSYSTNSMRKATGEGEILGKFNPGLGAQTFDFGGSAKFVPKGSDIVFEVHYSANGTPQKSRSSVGLVLAKAQPKLRYVTGYGPSAANLVIAPGDPHAEVVAEHTVTEPSKLVYVQPHLHLRGTDYEVRVVFPNGEKQTVFQGKFDFNWQLGYDLKNPVDLPVGAKIQSIAHYDNSANNRFNPDPTKEVIWGLQNRDEMQNCFMGFLIDAKQNPDKMFKNTGPTVLPRVTGKSGPTAVTLEASK